MFEWIIEKWLDKVIKPLENLVDGINAATGIYDAIENKLHIPYPYSNVFVLLFLLLIVIGILFIAGFAKALVNGDEINFPILRKRKKRNPPRRSDRHSG